MHRAMALLSVVARKGHTIASLGWTQHSVLALLGGSYIGLGFALCCVCAGQLSQEFRHAQPGAFNMLYGIFGFPMGLTLCVLSGASLFTSNVAYLLSAVLVLGQRQVHWYFDLVRVWLFSYALNLAGALLLGQMMLWAGIFQASDSTFVLELATKKVLGYTWPMALTRGILCNWMVCLAIHQAAEAAEAGRVTDAAVGIWLPISGFVALGFEHSVANMFLLPLALRLPGVSFSIVQVIWNNLLPVTIGNMIGGCLFYVVPYWTVLTLTTQQHSILGS